MATGHFSLDIDIRMVEGLADSLSRLTPERLGQVGLDAVNTVAVSTEEKARRNIGAGINMSDAYLRARMGVRQGTDASRPLAVIYAPYRHTPLGRYDPKQLVQPVKHPARSKGDPSRGIPAGSKGAGVSVEVRRGGRKAIAKGFLMPLANANGMGVFTRWPGQEKAKHRYGPSVYQLFRVQADALLEESGIDLQRAVIAEADRAIEESFT